MRRRGTFILGSLGLALTIGVQAWAAEPIKIGAILTLSGPAAFLGQPMKNTFKMWEEETNKSGGLIGRKVEVIIYDDEGEATKAVTAVDRLIKKDRVIAIVGPSTTGSSLAIVPKVEEAKIPLLAGGAAKKIVYPVKKWVFKIPQSDEHAVRQIFKHAKKNGITKLAIITASDGFGASGREELKAVAPDAGVTIVADEVFGPKDTDMASQLTRIKGTDAQAIVCWGTNPGPAVVARNRQQLAMKLPLYMSHGVAGKKFIELAGQDAAEGILLPAGRLIVEDQIPASNPQKKVLSAYKKDYESRFKEDVSAFGGLAWDAVAILGQAIRTANSADPGAIRDALERTKKFYGTGGEFNMSPDDHNGLTEDAFVMVQVVKGDWELATK